MVLDEVDSEGVRRRNHGFPRSFADGAWIESL